FSSNSSGIRKFPHERFEEIASLPVVFESSETGRSRRQQADLSRFRLTIGNLHRLCHFAYEESLGERPMPGLAFYRLPDPFAGWWKEDNGSDRCRQAAGQIAKVEISLMSPEDERLHVHSERIDGREGGIRYCRNRIVVKGNTPESSDGFKTVRQRREGPNCFSHCIPFNAAQRCNTDRSPDIFQIESARKRYLRRIHGVADIVTGVKRPERGLRSPGD